MHRDPSAGHLNPTSWWISGDFIHATQPTVYLYHTFSHVFPMGFAKFNKSNQQNQPQAHQLYWSLRRVLPSQLIQEFVHQPCALNVRRLFFGSQNGGGSAPSSSTHVWTKKKLLGFPWPCGFSGFFPRFRHSKPPQVPLRQRWMFSFSNALGPRLPAAAKCLRTSGSWRAPQGGTREADRRWVCCDFHIIEIRAPISWVIALCAIVCIYIY